MRSRVLELCIAAAILSVASGCIDPSDRRPGMRLSGNVVNESITEWSFANEVEEVFVETTTWYFLPHSVTTVCAGVGDALYVPSVYFGGGAWPDKFWNANVDSDPRVRMKIGENIYLLEATVVDEPAERELALRALASKYEFWEEQLSKPTPERIPMAIVRMDPRRD